MPPPRKVAKIVLVGESGVGKSSILSTYFGEPFSHVYVQTKGEVVSGVSGMITKVSENPRNLSE